MITQNIHCVIVSERSERGNLILLRDHFGALHLPNLLHFRLLLTHNKCSPILCAEIQRTHH
jgi:hypothetical protein